MAVAVIEEANWLSLVDDVRHMAPDVPAGTLFDAVLCLGNSLSALPPDFDAAAPGAAATAKHRRALGNFWALVRPGGLLVIDHRNYNCILETGIFPSSNIYYDVSTRDGTGSHFVIRESSDPGIQRPGDPVDPVTLFYNELQMSTYV